MSSLLRLIAMERPALLPEVTISFVTMAMRERRGSGRNELLLS
jgi:hypothetical protein